MDLKSIHDEALSYYKNNQIDKAINLFKRAADQNYLPSIKSLTTYFLLKAESSMDILPYVFKLMEKRDDKIAMKNVGLYKFNKTMYQDALKYFKLSKELGCKDINFYIALCHVNLENYKLGVEILHEIETQELQYMECLCACNCSIARSKICCCDPSCNMNHAKLQDSKKFTESRLYVFKIYKYIGFCYKKLNNYSAALYYFEKCYNYGSVASLMEQYYCHTMMGNYYLAAATIHKITETRNDELINEFFIILEENCNIQIALQYKNQMLSIAIEQYNSNPCQEEKDNIKIKYSTELNIINYLIAKYSIHL